MTYRELLEPAKRSDGQALETVTGQECTMGVYPDCPFVTPTSSGNGQGDGRKAAERFVARHNETGRLRPGDNADVSPNASYLIGLIRANERR